MHYGYYAAGEAHGCGGILNATTPGSLRSLDADGDFQYENALDCRWLIVAGENKVVRFNILPGFSLENHTHCGWDFLTVNRATWWILLLPSPHERVCFHPSVCSKLAWMQLLQHHLCELNETYCSSICLVVHEGGNALLHVPSKSFMP